ncbi:C-Myc-binding protein homolog [Myzus persicae]|uniref:C-Myc-binding protein homolog n=1 Tax=Myzus persicae TaxID=13164 RepID=UPI000B9354D4|nr:C-Myc-binding protein homolog [Myzus persicae]
MAGDDSNDLHSQIQKNCYPINRMTEEITNYFEKTGVIAKVTDVLKLLYEMNEKPDDPLEFMRTNMAEVIPEKMELTKLEEEYDAVMQEIAILQQENTSMTNRLKELETNESDNNNIEENTIIGFSDND